VFRGRYPSHFVSERLIALAAPPVPSRDFVPRRFLDAGRLRMRKVSVSPASKNLYKSGSPSNSTSDFPAHVPPGVLPLRKVRSTFALVGRWNKMSLCRFTLFCFWS
jgi:hypothetical protein